MSRRRHRRRGRESVGSVVDDSAHIAARFAPLGALTTGAVGFTVFYALLPMALMAWADANKAKLVGPAAAVFTNVLDQVDMAAVHQSVPVGRHRHLAGVLGNRGAEGAPQRGADED